MKCPSCHENTRSSFTCSQCGSTYCQNCQPFFDYEGNICAQCQEVGAIEAFQEDRWTSNLRRWFHKAAPVPDKPSPALVLPWKVLRRETEWAVVSAEHDEQCVCTFPNLFTAQYVVDAANAYYDLSMATATIYNRIRRGDPYWDGGKEDCELWSRIRSLLK